MSSDLEFLREIFKDQRLHIGIGVIEQTGIATDRSALRLKVNLIPENRPVIGIMAFNDINDVTFPSVNDLVMTASVDGDVDEVHIIKVINTKTELIPLFAVSGHSVRYSRKGTKLYLGSDTKVGVGRPDIEPTEPFVLGNVMISGLTALINAFLNASQIGQSAVGAVVLDPSVRQALVQFQQTYLTTASSNIVSQIAFTERGV